jgi:hypothetical protein
VDLSRRAALRRLFGRLVAHAAAAPGAGLSDEELVQAGWPDEKLRWDAALNRLRVAVTALRKLGLEKILVHRDGGYCLDPGTFLVPAAALDAVAPVAHI